MKTLVSLAIIGTSQAPNRHIATETEIDTLVEQLPAENIERKLLLAAGAASLYQEAGHTATAAPELPPIAEEEELPLISERAAILIEPILWTRNSELLPEVLHILRSRGLRLPYTLLQSALENGVQRANAREDLIAILGKRGIWLSRFNANWSWVAKTLEETERAASLDVLTAHWQEGSLNERRKALETLRRQQPALAREWLADTWKQERADTRGKLLVTLTEGLSLDDEAFLEAALDDRNQEVQAIAARILGMLSGSAFLQRMQARADALLSYSRETRKLTVQLPTEIDPAWKRDIHALHSTRQIPDWQELLPQLLAYVPPAHWSERFSTWTQRLLQATLEADPWSEAILTGWIKASIHFKDTEWASELWDCVSTHFTPLTEQGDTMTMLFSLMQQQAAEQKIVPHISFSDRSWLHQLDKLHTPWSVPFSQLCLQKTRGYIAGLTDNPTDTETCGSLLDKMAIHLHPDTLPAALETWDVPQFKPAWQYRSLQQRCYKFSNLITTRNNILEELPYDNI